LGEKIKVIIVDDEYPAREMLDKLIKNFCKDLDVIGKASSVKEAKEIIEEKNPDLVFLDINMPVETGFDLLAELPERDFLVVITSAYSEFGVQAIKAEVLDYLLKPINIDELKKVAEKAKEELIYQRNLDDTKNSTNGKTLNKLLLNHSLGFSMVDIDTIIRLRGDNNYTKIYLNTNKSLTVSRTLKEFEVTLGGKEFIRVHKSDIINLKYLKEYTFEDGGVIIMMDGSRLNISRRRHKEFMQKVKHFVFHL
jgi:two-component system, LytTR family, response regulator